MSCRFKLECYLDECVDSSNPNNCAIHNIKEANEEAKKDVFKLMKDNNMCICGQSLNSDGKCTAKHPEHIVEYLKDQKRNF